MSGQQIGTAVGFVAGFFLPGGPQVWAGIGGMLGGWIAPTQIEGPKLTDGMSVTAQDGVPNPWGFGTFAVGCNVINAFDLREVRETDDGKGSGQEQVTYRYTRSFALGICRAIRNTDGTFSDIAGILRVTHNGKDVYNVLPDATDEQRANNPKFMETCAFYLGGTGQQPDPTLEAYLGSGNVSAYVGQVYMVATDYDQTDARGAMGTWEFVVAMGGTVAATMAIAIGNTSTPTNRQVILRSPDGPNWVTATDPVSPSISATYISPKGNRFYIWDINNVYYTDGLGGQPVGPVATLSGSGVVRQAYTRTEILAIPNGSTYKRIDEEGNVTTIAHGIPSANGISNIAINRNSAVGFYVDSTFGLSFGAVCNSSAIGTWQLGEEIPIYAAGSHYISCSDTVFAIGGDSSNISPKPRIAYTSAPLVSWSGITLSASSGTSVAFLAPGDEGRWVALVNNGEIWWSDDNWQTANQSADSLPEIPTGLAWNGSLFIAGCGPSGNGSIWTSPDGENWAQQAETLDNITVLSGRVPSTDSITPETVALSTIVSEVCRRSGLESSHVDSSLLLDQVEGFKVAIETTGESIIASLMPAYFFDVAEWDDKLRFIPRGGDPVFTLYPEDLIARDGPLIEETETQEAEFLRKVIVRAMDPDAGYVETSQSWERRSSLVEATGEQTISLPVVMNRDTQRQTAHKRIKTAWSEPWRYNFAIPYTIAELTPTDCGVLYDRAGRARPIRLDGMNEDTGVIDIREAPIYRQSAYTSDVSGIPHGTRPTTAPRPPGPTYFWAGNLPSLKTSDSTPGMYISAAGYQTGWYGSAIYLSVDNGSSYQRVYDFTSAARMGTLTEEITSATEPISVFMNAGQLSTATIDQLAAGHNSFAITTAGVSEIGQFTEAVLSSSGIYEVSEVLRGALNTTAASHTAGDPFVMLSSVVFLPIDISHAGKTLIFKAVSYGSTLDDTDEYPVLFNPLFTSVVVEPYTDDANNVYTDDADNIYYYETSA